MPKLPGTTHLQFLVLTLLQESEQPGRDIRASLARHGERRSLPAFYQLMGRLEQAGLVAGRYAAGRVAGQPVKERVYAATEAGLRAWRRAREFYAEAGRSFAVEPERS